MKTEITVEYEVEADTDVPIEVILDAFIANRVELTLVTPGGQERKVRVNPTRAYPQKLSC